MAEYGLRSSLTAGLRRASRAKKFITLLLLFILLTAATAGVTAVLTGPDWASLWVSLLFGLLIGWALAIFRLRAWRSVILAIGLGFLFSLLFTAGLDEKVLAVFTELFRLGRHIISPLKTSDTDLSPLRDLTMQVFTSSGVVLSRVYAWLKDLVIGQPAFDPVAAGFVWSMVVWLVAAWAGWIVEAGRNALIAVLPALMLNLSTLSYGRSNSASIYIILGTMLVLISVVQYDQHEQEWSETRVAYPARKSRLMVNIAVIIAIFLVVLSASISSLSLQRIINWNSEASRSSGQPENGLAKSLGIVPATTPTPDAFNAIRSPGLPHQLLIGSGPELSTRQVMSVEVKDLASLLQGGQLPPLYWRSFTYDIYTGHGWSTSATEQRQYKSGQPLQPDSLPGHLLNRQVIRPVPGEGGVIYAAGEPVSMSVPGSAAWRTSNDLFGIQTGENGYEVLSLVPSVDENSLRAAGQVYPSWVVKRYLALPDEVPPRLKALAIQLTATEPTVYDRARAIEQYLRNFPYSLDVPYPPANQDLADYFLFDLRKGYCDYYASTMVVLARAAGLPARLATGYASGIYNLNSERFIVTQADAHSWVELYFPGIGWVPFEPTAGLPAINRSGQRVQEPTPSPAAPALPSSGVVIGNIWKYFGYGFAAVTVFTIFILVVFDEARLSRLKPQPAAQEVYRRLRHIGKLLNVPIEGGVTPFEYADAFGTRIAEITRQGFAAGASMSIASQILSIMRKIVRLSYRPSEIGSAPLSGSGIIDQWKSLRWRLRLLWIVNVLTPAYHILEDGLAGHTEKHQASSE